MGDEAAVVASEYQGLDGQVKGLLAFVEALQVSTASDSIQAGATTSLFCCICGP